MHGASHDCADNHLPFDKPLSLIIDGEKLTQYNSEKIFRIIALIPSLTNEPGQPNAGSMHFDGYIIVFFYNKESHSERCRTNEDAD
jgi:hypothetical protein